MPSPSSSGLNEEKNASPSQMESEQSSPTMGEENHASVAEESMQCSQLKEDLTRERQKNSSLFMIIGGVLCFEAGRLFQTVHEVIPMACAVVAVILSVYGLFHYFEAYRR